MTDRPQLRQLTSTMVSSSSATPAGTSPAVAASVNFDVLMQAHLARVFNERDGGRRRDALQELYTGDATFFEPHAVVTGYEAISSAIDALQASLPPDFVFTASGIAIGHNGIARLHWHAGPPDGPVAVTGTDVAQVENGRIKALYVFVDPAAGEPGSARRSSL
jgi:hypothetical protein